MSVRRRRRSPVAHVRRFWMPIAFGVALVVGGLIFAATWTGFEPKQIVVSGNRRVSRGEILARAAVVRHVSMWLQNTGAMATRISAIPYIASARILRLPPATLRIAVTERAPFAIVSSSDEKMLVDRALRVLEPAPASPSVPSFVVKPGLDLTPGSFVKTSDAFEMRDVYDAMTAHQIMPVELKLDRFGGLEVTLHGGLQLLLGSRTDLDQKLILANAIIAQTIGRQHVAAVDLRAPSAPVLIYR